jgi:hypothetical protein
MRRTLLTAVFASFFATAGYADSNGSEKGEAESRDLQGEVLGVEGEQLILDVDGAAVALKVDRETEFEGEQLESEEDVSSKLEEEYEAGQMVNVTYSTMDMENHAEAIEKADAEGEEAQRDLEEEDGIAEPAEGDEDEAAAEDTGGFGTFED